MVESPPIKLAAFGFSVHLVIVTRKESWVDVIISIENDRTIGTGKVSSVPFYISFDEIERFVRFLNDQSQVGHDNSFVPTSLGFELSIFDPDEVETTVQIMLNIGTYGDSRVYAGNRGQVEVSELHRFATELLSETRRVLPSSSA